VGLGDTVTLGGPVVSVFDVAVDVAALGLAREGVGA